MAVVSREHGYLFIAVPGTGSTATAHALVSERVYAPDLERFGYRF